MKKYKTLLLIAATILTAAYTVLADFISARFSVDIFKDASYWINIISVQSAFIILILMRRTLAIDKERKENTLYTDRWEALKDAYVTLNEKDMTGTLDEYIRTDNRARKLEKYRRRLGRHHTFWLDRVRQVEILLNRMEIIAKDRGKKVGGFKYEHFRRALKKFQNKRDFWADKLARADAEVDFVRVRYIRYSQSLLFNEVEESVRESNDPSAHNARHVMFLLATKGLSIFAFGVITTSYFDFDFSWSWGALYLGVVKLLQTVLSLYVGTVSGQSFVSETLCAKLLIRYNYVKKFMERHRLGFNVSELAAKVEAETAAEAAAHAETSSDEPLQESGISGEESFVPPVSEPVIAADKQPSKDKDAEDVVTLSMPVTYNL